MTEGEIKKIAREVARLLVHPDDYSPYREQVYRQVKTVITQLSNDYCIVEKDVARGLYEAHINESRGLEKGCREWFFYEGRTNLMETLFGKELFNGKEE